MRYLLLALTLVACGGPQSPTPFYEGTWDVQFGPNVSGTMTLRPLASASTPQLDGTWDFGGFGSGTVAGNVGASDGSSVDLFFVKPDHFIAGDASATVIAGMMTGIARTPTADAPLTAHRH